MNRVSYSRNVAQTVVVAIFLAYGFFVSGCGPNKAESDAEARGQLEIIDYQMSANPPRPMNKKEVNTALTGLDRWKADLTPQERRLFESNDEEAISKWLDENPQKEVSLIEAMQP